MKTDAKDMTEKSVNPSLLRDLITVFSWLDYEHQERACGALNTILEDQITENKTKR